MLKLKNCILAPPDLNTPCVKAKQTTPFLSLLSFAYLNTSYVKAKLI